MDKQKTKKKNESIYKQTPGQIVLEKLFDSGTGYMSYGGSLRKYNPERGCYEELNEDHLKCLIANFYNNDPEMAKYSIRAKIIDALEYMRIRTYVPQEKLNPPGVNLRNGYLKLSYSAAGYPIFILEPHSMDTYFTYCADVEYNPNADDSILNKVLDEMIGEQQQSTLLRTIAAQFDLSKVKQHIGRPKALILLGDGSNGKDTIREWVSKFFAEGFTSIGLQAFKLADQGRTFGIFNLSRSKINWSSENTIISLDSCQSLKNAISGDPMDAEEKHKPAISIKSKCVLLFNINELPRLEAQKEAILSRFGVIHFPHIFKMKPDPSKKHEKQADPKFKEDDEFIKKNILPALLNRLVKEFCSIFVDGINYGINPELLKDIQENSNHLLQFINEKYLRECKIENGLDVTYIHNEYLNWCLEVDHIECDVSDGCDINFHKTKAKIIKYHDPNSWDKIVRSPVAMGKKLKEIFSHAIRSRTGSQRTIGLNFFGC